LGDARGLTDRVVILGPVVEVVTDRLAEEEALLRDEADLGAKGGEREVAEVDAVESGGGRHRRA